MREFRHIYKFNKQPQPSSYPKTFLSFIPLQNFPRLTSSYQLEIKFIVYYVKVSNYTLFAFTFWYL